MVLYMDIPRIHFILLFTFTVYVKSEINQTVCSDDKTIFRLTHYLAKTMCQSHLLDRSINMFVSKF